MIRTVTRFISSLFLILFFLGCSKSDELSIEQKDEIRNEVRGMFDQYHSAIGKEGLTGEFAYLDNSADFFWVPPAYTSALDYDSVKTILEANSKGFQSIEFHWDTLSVSPLSKTIANYSGIVKGVMTDTAGVKLPVAIIESGTVIKRNDGWKLLSGQSAVLPAKSNNEQQLNTNP